MTLSEELTWRGFLGQTTFENLAEIDAKKMTFYWGVDPSNSSMTVGNLAAFILALHFIRAGNRGILLVGGATGMAGGDPDGKDETRAKISLENLSKNVDGIRGQFSRIFANFRAKFPDEKLAEIEIVNNFDWFSEIKFIDFLREIEWNFSLTQMLDREFIKSRIGENGRGMNVAEFLYATIQGYDFYHLYREKNAVLQLCATDQFGNCAAGMSLIRKKIPGARADIFAMPLVINKSTGKKFGKSENGAVFLAPEKTSPLDFYQFWLNVEDSGVLDYLKIYTFLPREEIEKIAQNSAENPENRAAQKILAREITALVHGEKIARNVEKVSEILFDKNAQKIDFAEISADEIDILAREIPVVNLRENLTIIDVLTEAKIANSRGEARNLIAQNSVSKNGEKISADEILAEKSLIKKGKNKFVLVK